MKTQKKIGIVGPCNAGKSTLIDGLNQYGYKARHIAQEHSYVPEMWKIITNPEILIYLDVSYPISKKRKDLFHWTEIDYQRQLQRLAHARSFADMYINTDELSPLEVLERVIVFLKERTENL